MIDVTIKTLDSQNHSFSVQGDITVKKFKEHITSAVSIPPDKQRLIYCGRVLQDEKKLAEYNVHEKVIHLVARAPPQPNSRSSSADTTSSRSRSRGASSRYSVLRRPSMPDGQQVLLGSFLVPDDALDSLTTAPGPSSSGVRLQQAKTMLDQASAVLDSLDEKFDPNARPATTTEGQAASSPNSTDVDMQTDSEVAGSSQASSNTRSRKDQEQKPRQLPEQNPTEVHSRIPATDISGIFSEIDSLHNMEPAMLRGSQLGAMVGTPLMGSLNPSLAGGLAQAASAAVVSALSSFDGTSSSGPSQARVVLSQSNAADNAAPETRPQSVPRFPFAPGFLSAGLRTSSPSTSRSPSSAAASPSATSSTASASTSQAQPRLRLLEHPRTSVMVDVLNQYRSIQRRLEPYMEIYYQTMLQDRQYPSVTCPELQVEQWLISRVSECMHFVSHGMHAISDIIIDLRRDPPRQLRARPIIIPQPSLVQAQINVASAEGPRLPQTPNGAPTSSSSSTTTTSSTTGRPRRATSSASRSSSAGRRAPPTDPSGYTINMPNFSSDDGMVVMQVGPNGITIDSLAAEPTGNESGTTPELLQNILSSITSEIGMHFGPESADAAVSQPSNSASSPTTGANVRSGTPGHNSQAAGNSTTNTTNATQTRVTPMPHVHVTPLHVPGMGMSQFDPFLPCQSHHLRSRRRHNATVQFSANIRLRERNAQPREGSTTATPSTPATPQSDAGTPPAAAAPAPTAAPTDSFLADLLHNPSDTTAPEMLLRTLAQSVMSQEATTFSQDQPFFSLYNLLNSMALGSTEDENTLFGRIFNTMIRTLGLADVVMLFAGDWSRLDVLHAPLQTLLLENRRPQEATSAFVHRVYTELTPDIQRYIITPDTISRTTAESDFGTSLLCLISDRLSQILTLICDHSDRATFGASLGSLASRSFNELVALCRHLFVSATVLEDYIAERVGDMLRENNVANWAGTVESVRVQIRDVIARVDAIRPIININTYLRARVETPEQPTAMSTNGLTAETTSETRDEPMDVDMLEPTSPPGVEDDEPPIEINVGQQPWHSAVPEEWIPVIARDVERQRRGVPESSPSDAYMCGMPLKRRRIACQNKPHGTVQEVMQSTLRTSLRTAGVSQSNAENLSQNVSESLQDNFAGHVRSALSDKLRDDKDFRPEKFPKSEQKIRKK